MKASSSSKSLPLLVLANCLQFPHHKQRVVVVGIIVTFALWAATSSLGTAEAYISAVDSWTAYVTFYSNFESHVSSGQVSYDWPNRRMRFDGRTNPDTDDDPPTYTEIKLNNQGRVYFILNEVGGQQCFVETEIVGLKYTGIQSGGNQWQSGYTDGGVINGFNTYYISQVIYVDQWTGYLKYWYYFTDAFDTLHRLMVEEGSWICPYWSGCYWSGTGRFTYWDFANFQWGVDPNVFNVPTLCTLPSGSIMDFPGNTYITP